MFKETLADLSDNPFEIKILGKGLIYKVDLQGHIEVNQQQILLTVHGSIRFGVWKSDGEFRSIYRLDLADNPFVEHSIRFPKISFVEEYFQDQGTIKYKKNEQQELDVPLRTQPVFDPLPLVFKLFTLMPGEDVLYSGGLLVGGKQKVFEFEKKQTDIRVQVDGRPLFSGKIKDQTITIVLAKIKAKLVLQRV